MNNEKQKHLENLSEIRSIMERSSSFLSLSGLGGIFAGVFALAGAGFAWWLINIYHGYERRTFIIESGDFSLEIIIALMINALVVLILAITFGYIFTHRNAKKKGIKLWNKSSKLLLINLFIPLIVGGIFVLILIWHGAAFIISATTLIFYGLALINIYHVYERRTFIIESGDFSLEIIIALMINALVVLILAITFGYIFTHRNAKKKGIKLWNKSSKLLLINLFIPLIVGGIFVLILIWHGAAFIISATTLIFYGLALINASKYTVHDIRYLGVSQVILGLIAAVDIGYGIIYWALGFGIMHIIYGTIMYFKYERKIKKQ